MDGQRQEDHRTGEDDVGVQQKHPRKEQEKAHINRVAAEAEHPRGDQPVGAFFIDAHPEGVPEGPKGERKAQVLKAEGYQQALEAIYAAAQNIDQKTMTLQYFETLKSMASGSSTKYIFPMEFTSLLSDFVKKNTEK